MLSLDQITFWLLSYKYAVVFPLAVIEGPIVTVIIGFFSSLGYFNFFLAYIVIVIGDLAGDAFHYLIGRWGGQPFVEKWGRYLGVGAQHLEALEKQFDRRGEKLLFIGKMTHGIGGAFLIAAGVIKMPFKKFMFSNLLATLIKSLLLLLLGFYFGQALSSINNYLQKIALITAGLAALTVLLYFFYFKKNSGTTKS